MDLKFAYFVELNIGCHPTKFEFVPDQVGTLAQVGTSPNLGWPNKELRDSQPV